MTRDDIIAKLRAHRAELERRKLTSLALFGSFARGEAGADSDIDLLFDYDPARVPGYIELGVTEVYLEGLLGRPVELVPRRSLRPHVRPGADRDAISVY
jgi:predicted nucleotidyltransferase